MDSPLTGHLGLAGKSLISVTDLTPAQLLGLVTLADRFRDARRSGKRLADFAGAKSMAMLFQKASLRTRVTFELGMKQMGGITMVLGPDEVKIGVRETATDVGANLGRWVDIVMARVFDHRVLVELRDAAAIPVVNGLSDHEHPCQALADLQALGWSVGPLGGRKLAYIGDGNNVLHSLMLACAMSGMTIASACPEGYEPDTGVVAAARRLAGSDDRVTITSDPAEAAKGADAVYTDVWASMGQEDEAAIRRCAFSGYQVDRRLMDRAAPNAVFMHCLPAHRGEEVAAEVIDSNCSIVFDQAECRLYAQQAVVAALLGA